MFARRVVRTGARAFHRWRAVTFIVPWGTLRTSKHREVNVRAFGLNKALFALGTACLIASVARHTRAEDSAKCVQSFENAQKLRKEGKLLRASEELILCSQPTCPAFISKECTTWFSEVQASQPSVTFSAKEGDRLLNEVRVSIDGEVVTERIDGRSIPVDPGLHEFKFEVAGREPVIVRSLAVEGNKNAVITAEFPPVVEETPPPAAPESPPVMSVTTTKQRPPVLAFVIGGVGVLGVGAGVALRVLGAREYSDLEKECKPNCASSEVDRVKLKYTLSDVAFGVGGAAIVTAGVMLLLNGGSSEPEQQTGVTVAPTLRGTGATALWTGRF